MSEYLQVKRTDLLEYIANTELLRADHDRLEEELKINTELAKIVREDQAQKLDKLIDQILDQTNRSQYYMGLMTAYEIMTGRIK